MAKTLNARIITKHDLEENWNKAESFIPKLGEIIIYDIPEDNIYSQYNPKSVSRIKVGDGQTICKDLHYITEPYVVKEYGKKLSTNDYTNFHYSIVDKIANLGYEPQYTDTKYVVGYGLGIKNGNNLYSTGVIDINEGTAKGTFKCAIGKGPNGEYEEKTITIAGLTETAFTPLSNFLDSSTAIKINNSIISLEPSKESGTIEYTNAIGEIKHIVIPGWENLATKEDINIESAKNVGVIIQHQHPLDAIPIWINNKTGTLKFYDNISKTYKDIEGVFKSASNTYISGTEIIKGIKIETNIGNTELFVGVTDIEKTSDGTKLKVNINGTTKNVDINPIVAISGGSTNGTIKITINGKDYTGSVTGLKSNAFSDDAYLKLSGGTITESLGIKKNLTVEGTITGNKVYGAVYNDYAEYRQSIEHIESGYIVYSDDDGILRKTKNRLQHFEGVVSDTFGFSIGKTDKAQTPLAVAGRVLVYTDEELHAGDVVCAGENGKASKMDNIEIANKPDRIVGIVSEIPTYETWGEENIPVNGRVWIRVK